MTEDVKIHADKGAVGEVAGQQKHIGARVAFGNFSPPTQPQSRPQQPKVEKGRTVKFQSEQGFDTYGKVVEVGIRVRVQTKTITSSGRVVKHPTTKGVAIRRANGMVERVPLENVKAIRYYGVDRPLGGKP